MCSPWFQDLHVFLTHPLMTDMPPSVGEASLDVLFLEPRVSFQDVFHRISRSEQTENMLNSQPAASDDWFTAEDLRIHREASEQFVLAHWKDSGLVFPIGNRRQSRSFYAKRAHQPNSPQKHAPISKLAAVPGPSAPRFLPPSF